MMFAGGGEMAKEVEMGDIAQRVACDKLHEARVRLATAVAEGSATFDSLVELKLLELRASLAARQGSQQNQNSEPESSLVPNQAAKPLMTMRLFHVPPAFGAIPRMSSELYTPNK